MATAVPVTGPASCAATASPPTPAKLFDIAHRGASGHAPENTLAAVRKGVEQRADLVEVDVHLSADGEPVVIHDAGLRRTTNAEEIFPDRAPWNVGDFTLAEIRSLDAGSWFGPEFARERVPTLGEVLDALSSSRVGLLLEVKSPKLYPGIGARIAAELAAHPGFLQPAPQPARLVVQSFDWAFMRAFHELLPDVPNGLLGAPGVDQLADLASFADQINPRHDRVDAEYVARVHAFGMRAHVWTVNGRDAMRRAIGIGVDGIITNYPDVLLEVLHDRS